MPVEIDKLSEEDIKNISRDSSLSKRRSIYDYNPSILPSQGVNGIIQTDTTHIQFQYRDAIRNHSYIISTEGKGQKAREFDNYKELEP